MIKLSPLETFLMNPFILLLTVAVLWLVTHVLFWYYKSDNACLKKWEIVYLLVGFLGITSIALEFKKTRYSFGLEYRESFIKDQISSLHFYKKYFCVEFIKSEYSPVDFDDRQRDQDLLCKWVEQIEIPSDTLEYIMKNDLEIININNFNFKTDFADSLILDYNSRVSSINRDIAEYRQQKKESTSEVPFVIKILTIPFLVIALALRLGITTYNLYLLRKKTDASKK